MISLLANILATALFILSAWPLTRFFRLSMVTEKLGVALLLGTGLGTFIWYLLYLTGLPFTLPTLLFSLIILFLLGYFISLRTKPVAVYHLGKLKSLDKILVAIICLGLLAALIISSYNPITAWDSMALYDSRAKAILLHHDLRIMTDNSYYISYPLYVTLTHAATYFLGGSNAQSMHTFLFAAFLAIVYGRLSLWTIPRLALIGVSLNLFTFELFMHSTIAYANLPYTILLVSGLLYAVSEDNKSHGKYLIIAGLMLGLSTWVRSMEVFWLLGAVLIIWYGYRLRLIKAALISLLLVLIIRQGWSLYFSHLAKSLTVPPLSPLPIFSKEMLSGVLANGPKILIYLKNNVILPYLGFWGMAAGVAVLSYRRQHGRTLALIFVITASFFTTAAGTAVFSTFFPTWFEIGDSARRMLMFLSPLAITAAVTVIYPLIPKRYVK